jgi:hypothetical protein
LSVYLSIHLSIYLSSYQSYKYGTDGENDVFFHTFQRAPEGAAGEEHWRAAGELSPAASAASGGGRGKRKRSWQ